MSKRFTDTEKWDKPWYRKLPSKYKLLWHFITDKCTSIGLWHVDLETAGYYTGETYSLDDAKVCLGKQIQVLAEGTKWFIRDFIPFQYGTLNPANHFHRSILKTLEENGVTSLGCPTPQGWGVQTPQERKGKDDVDVVVDVKKGRRETFTPPTHADIEAFAKEQSLPLDIPKFFNHYASKGWMVGRNKMKDWKAAARNAAKEWATTKPERNIPSWK